MIHKLLVFSIFFITSLLVFTNQESVKQPQKKYQYQFDENQKRLIMITDESATQTTEVKQDSYSSPDCDLPKMQYKTYEIDLEQELTGQMINDWINTIIPNDQTVIVFCFQTKSFDHHIDTAMIFIEEKIIPILIDRGFSPDCMLKTVKLEQGEKHLDKDRIQITIFFSDNTLDSISSTMVDIDMKL